MVLILLRNQDNENAPEKESRECHILGKEKGFFFFHSRSF